MNNVVWVIDYKEIDPAALTMLRDNGYTIMLNNPDASEKSNIVGIFVRTYTTIDDVIIHDLPNLKFILKAGVGLDNIDLTLAKNRGIQIYNSPGSNAKSVAEYVVGCAIFSLHKINQQSQKLQNGEWRSFNLIGDELSGKTFGMVGLGAVGREVAKRLIPFEVELLAYDPYVSPDFAKTLGVNLVGLDDLLQRSDIISIQSPLTKETKGMFNKTRLSLIKNGATLINVSRGELIDEVELIQCVKDGKIDSIALDVFCNEPNIDKNLQYLPNTLLSPHIAGFTKQAHQRMAVDAVNNLFNSNPSKFI